MNDPLHDSRILHGMERQLLLRQARLNAGEKSIGWKVGFGAPAARQRLNISAPLVGFLTDKTLLPSGVTVALDGWTKPAVEPEIAVHLGSDLGGKANPQATKAAIASIGPAIELADVKFPPDDVEKILAGNIYNRYVILGDADPSRAGCKLNGLIGRVSHNTQQLQTVSDLQALTGDIVDIVRHVANLVSLLGERLQAGEFIIAGSILPPIWVKQNDRISYTLEPMRAIAIEVR